MVQMASFEDSMNTVVPWLHWLVVACCHGYLMCVEEGGELAERDDKIIKHLTELIVSSY